MKYEVEIDGRTMNLDLDPKDGRITVTINDRRYEAEVYRPEKGVYLLFVGSEVFEATVSDLDSSMSIRLGAQAFTARVIDRKHRSVSLEHGSEGQQLLTAPMPGKVVKVLLEAGSEVAVGQGVIIVEAMKMQNEIKSPKVGRVTEIRVREGDTVNANQVLAVVE